MTLTPKDRLIAALDVNTLAEAQGLVQALAPFVGCFKVGLELLTREGAPQVVRAVQGWGGQLFFDGKFDDIPNTVEEASRAAASLGVKFFDVHASAGRAAVAAAAKAKGSSLLLAVTALTSLSDDDCAELFGASSEQAVVRLARLAAESGADGVVCSPRELGALQKDPVTAKLLKVTPGIRPAWAAAGDQKRTLTPREAVAAGADYLVIGRPLTRPPQGTPAEAARKILEELS